MSDMQSYRKTARFLLQLKSIDELIEESRQHAQALADWMVGIQNQPELQTIDYVDSFINKTQVLSVCLELVGEKLEASHIVKKEAVGKVVG